MMEQRANIKFCFKTGKTATETFQLKKQAYGDNAVSRTRVSERYLNGLNDFKDEREELQGDPRSGRPSTSRNADTIATSMKW
jgi:hypothetical protein